MLRRRAWFSAALAAAISLAAWQPPNAAGIPAGYKRVATNRYLQGDGFGFPTNMCVGEKKVSRFRLIVIDTYENAAGRSVCGSRSRAMSRRPPASCAAAA